MDTTENVSIQYTLSEIEPSTNGSINQTSNTISKTIPKLVFIIPYRDRELQRDFFIRQMSYVLQDMNPDEYKIYFVEQCDTRSFNRGAMKNIGFLAIRDRYPEHYQNMTFVFNDVDTMPFTKGFLDYPTTHGVIKHFYGFKFALGGIISVTGRDFERINGFPNFWTWGFEDNLLNQRSFSHGIHIDRTQFYNIHDKHIIQLSDGLLRSVNRSEFDRYTRSTKEGWNSITGLTYDIKEQDKTIKVLTFNTGRDEDKSKTKIHNLKEGNKPFTDVSRGGRPMNFTFLQKR